MRILSKNNIPDWLKYLINVAQEIFGFKRLGAYERLDDENEWDPLAAGTTAPSKRKNIDLLGTIAQDQGMTNECVYFATAHLVSILESQLAHKHITIEGHDLTKLGKKYPGTFDEDRGDFIYAGFKAIEKSGYTDKTGKKYELKDHDRINRDEIYDKLAEGKPILTGVRCLRPLCTSNWMWRTNSTGGGHCILIIGYDKKRNSYVALNSWGENWGHRWSGRFFIPVTSVEFLMPCYIPIKD